MLLFTVKMPLSLFIAAWTVLAVASVAAPPARAEPAVPYDRCDYMNHDSKAYKACIADAAQAKLRAEAAAVPPVSPPKPKPEAQPRTPRRRRS
jgi:hypothetical protein